jgi:hypothetical protein
MANSTISNLPPATTLSGTELVPVVQGGVTKAATAAQFGGGGAGSPNFTVPVTIKSGDDTLAPLKLYGTRTDLSGDFTITYGGGTPFGTLDVSVTVPSGSGGNLSFSIQDVSAGKLPALVLNSKRSAVFTGGVYTQGDVSVRSAGNGLQVSEVGGGAKQGVTTLVAGAKVVANANVTASSRIFLTVQSLGTVTAPKAVAVTARTVGTSFTITSADATDTSVVAWEIFEPASAPPA